MEKKIGLINVYNDTIRNHRYSGKYLNLSIMKLTGFLLRNGVDAERIKVLTSDYSKESKEIVDLLINQIEKFGLDYLGFSTYMWNSEKVIEIVTQLININDKIKIIIGGPDVSNIDMENENLLKVIGKGEIALMDILNSDNEFDFLDSDNTNKGDKEYVNISDTYGALYSEEFLERGDNFKDINTSFGFYETSTGCPYECGFCTYDVEKKGLDFKNIEEIIIELKNIKSLGIKKLFVIDPIFGSKKERGKQVMKLFNEIIPNVELIIFLRSEFLDDEYIEILSKANIVDMKIGIQSLNPDVPKWLRSNNLKLVNEYLPKLSKNNIPWRAELIVGLIGDTMNGLRETFRTVIDVLNPTFFYGYHLNIPKNTKLMECKDKVDSEEWIKGDENGNALSSNSYSEEELKEMLLFSLMMTSLHRSIKRNNHKKIVTFNYLENIIESFGGYGNIELINFFEKANHEDAEEFWNGKVDNV